MSTDKAPTAATAHPHLLGRRIDLAWINPPASAFAGGTQTGITIVRRERTFPLRPDDGTIVYDTTSPLVDHFADTGLTPLTRYYYTVFAFDGTDHHAGPGSQASALATDEYGLAERLYRLLPAVHQREDAPLRPDELRELAPDIIERLDALPPHLRGTGQLRRFLSAVGATAGMMRSNAEALPQLHDVDQVPPQYLSLLGQFLDWHTDRSLPVFAQRNEIRAAPWLYRTVGTVPNLRAIVTRYTGWQARVAEHVQHIARSNHPPGGNLFALAQTASGAWQASDDAATVLGFGLGNTDATGQPGKPAVLEGTITQPFALRPGMQLTVTADARAPVAARFTAADAADLATATAAEVAAALGRQAAEIIATATADGRLRLRSQTSGSTSTLHIESAEASLVALDGAPRGRLAIVATGPADFRLFYAAADPLAPAERHAARRAATGIGFPRPPAPGQSVTSAAAPDPADRQPPATPVSRLRCKAFRNAHFGDAVDVFPGAAVPAGDPAAALLPPAGPGQPARILLAWLDQPGTGAARMRYTIGIPSAPRPALLIGERSSPLPVPHGGLLVLRTQTAPPRGVHFARTDFADPDAPTVDEVADVLNTRAAGVLTASVLPGQRLRLQSLATGGDAYLSIDLRLSSAAAALGFGEGNHIGYGQWGDEVGWQPPRDISPVAPGWLADLAATSDADGAVLAYARHDGTAWQIRALTFDGADWIDDQRLTTGPLSAREPALGRDGTGRVWALWARQGATASARWSLRRRTRDPATGLWDLEAEVTPVPAQGREGDREPAIAFTAASPHVYFRSDRAGGSDLWQQPLGGPATAVTAGASASSWPSPVDVAGARWLLHRSDRSVAHAGVGSGQATDTGTVRRYAGTTTVVLSDSARIERLHAFDDLIAYTPHRPDGYGMPPGDDEPYTRGTIALHLTPAVPGPLDEQTAERLRGVLGRFLPYHTRAIIRFEPAGP